MPESAHNVAGGGTGLHQLASVYNRISAGLAGHYRSGDYRDRMPRILEIKKD